MRTALPVHAGIQHRPCSTKRVVACSCSLGASSNRRSLRHVNSSGRTTLLPLHGRFGLPCSSSSTCYDSKSSASGYCSSSCSVSTADSTPSSSACSLPSCTHRPTKASNCTSSSAQQHSHVPSSNNSSSSSSRSTQALQEQPQCFAVGAATGMLAGLCLCSHRQRYTSTIAAAAVGCSRDCPPAPWGVGSSSALRVPHKCRQRRQRGAVQTAAFGEAAAAAASASSTSWHQALGLTFRGVLWGIAFTLGSQLLLALLLRTIWAQRAIAALESWLQAVFGISLRGDRASSYSAENTVEEASDSEDEDGLFLRSNGTSRTSSSSSSSSSFGSSSSGILGGNGSSSSSSTSSGSSGRRHKKDSRAAERAARAAMVHNAPGESVEWVNMCFRKIWRVYQRGLERWITDLLQPVFDALINPTTQPGWLLRLRIVEFTLDHEAPYFSNMRRRNSRKDSDLTGVVDLRYTGGARLLLMLELGQGRWRFKIPVLVSDLDVQCALWLKLRLAPMCPWVGTISLAFVGPPAVKVQLSPYNRVRLMRIPVLQKLLNQLLTVDLPAMMVLPERLEISIPPSVTSIAEAAVGRDTIMRAVASAVLQVDSLEQALLAALPLGPQGAAGGVSLPDLFRGELTVLLREGRDLPVWGMPWQSNPWVRLVLGEQAVASRRDSETSTASRHGHPVWNQEVQFLVEDPEKQVLEVYVNDSHLTGRPKVGKAVFMLKDLPPDGRLSLWLPLEPVNPGQRPQGEVHLELTYKAFEDDEQDSGFREAQEYAKAVQQQSEAITDIRSAAAASSRAAVAASAAISAIAMTKAAAARAAARAAQAAKDAGTAVANTAAAVSGQQLQQQPQQQQQDGPLLLPPPGQSSAAPQDAKAAAAAVTAAVAAAKDSSSDRDKDDGDSGAGGNGSAAAAADAVAAAAEVGEDVEAVAAAAAKAAAAARRREEALIEALEARMSFKVRSTSGTPRPQQPAAAAAPVHGNGSSNGRGDADVAKARGATDDADVALSNGATADMSVTLPADSFMSDSDEEEQRAAERAQKAVVDILEKSKRMEAAVAELAALTAGSPTEAALQQGAKKAAADAVAALSAFQSADTAVSSSSTTTAADVTVRPPSGITTMNGSSSNGSGSSSRRFGDFGSSYSIWDEESSSQAVQQQQEQQQHVEHHIPGPEDVSEYSIWGESLLTQQQQQQLPQQQQQEQRPVSPSIVVRVKDGQQVLSEVVGGGSTDHDVTVQASQIPDHAVGSTLDKAVQTDQVDLTDSTTSSRTTEDRPWWSSVVFWLPGQKVADAAGTSTSSSSDADDRSSSPDGPKPDTDAELSAAEPISTAQRAWWQPLLDNDFIKSLPSMTPQQQQQQQKKKKGAESSAIIAAAAAAEGQEDGSSTEQQQKQRQWWEVDLPWFKLGNSDEADISVADVAGGANGAKPVEAIVIPADLPLEEIAKEVAKLKEDAWKSKEDHLESLWAKTVERNDRSWLMLLCFLLTVVIGLLTVVAYRISGLGGDVPPPDQAEAAVQVAGQLPVMLLGLAAAAAAHYGLWP